MDRDEVREREKWSLTPGDWREWGWEWENNPLSSSASCIREKKKLIYSVANAKVARARKLAPRPAPTPNFLSVAASPLEGR